MDRQMHPYCPHSYIYSHSQGICFLQGWICWVRYTYISIYPLGVIDGSHRTILAYFWATWHAEKCGCVESWQDRCGCQTNCRTSHCITHRCFAFHCGEDKLILSVKTLCHSHIQPLINCMCLLLKRLQLDRWTLLRIEQRCEILLSCWSACVRNHTHMDTTTLTHTRRGL